MKQQAQREEEAFEEFCREAAHAARADEKVINAAADSPFLFQRVRAHLAQEAMPPVKHNWLTSRAAAGQVWKWAVAATAMAALIAGLALTRAVRQATPEQPPQPMIAQPMVEKLPVDKLSMPGLVPPTSQPEAPKTVANVHANSGRSYSPRRSSIKGPEEEEEEVTTEYLPLTYLAYAEDAGTGHVVRIQVQRAALLTLGVPVGAEPSAELVKADIIVGDDGLARAIRLVR